MKRLIFILLVLSSFNANSEDYRVECVHRLADVKQQLIVSEKAHGCTSGSGGSKGYDCDECWEAYSKIFDHLSWVRANCDNQLSRQNWDMYRKVVQFQEEGISAITNKCLK